MASALDVLDYKAARPKLFINKVEVGSLTMVGLLAERIPNIAKNKAIAWQGVNEGDLPDHLAVSLDGRGVCKVGLYSADKTLSLTVAKAVRAKLSGVGLELQETLVPVRNAGGRKLGERDMLLQLVSDGEGGLPVQAERKYVSGELKLRRLWAEAEQQRRRRKLQAACEGIGGGDATGACAWWPNERGKYAGRLLVMVVFTDKQGAAFKVGADVKLSGDGQWRPVFGWPGSARLHLRPQVQPQLQPQPATAMAKARPQPLPKSKALIHSAVLSAKRKQRL